VTVPQGASQVEFRYEPRAFPLGIAIAVAGLVAFVAVWLVSGWRRRRGAGVETRRTMTISSRTRTLRT
jgi:hypothetical protein